jgi:SAM-dependent methyltransferase
MIPDAPYQVISDFPSERDRVLSEAVKLHDTRWYQTFDDFWVALHDSRRTSGAKYHNRRGIIRSIRKRFAANDEFSVLDAGCGDGSLLAMIREAFPRATLVGVDVSARALDFAARQVDATLMRLDLEHERLDAAFDIVIANETLQFVRDDRAVIAKLAKMCKDRLILLVYDVDIRDYPECVYWGEYRTYDRSQNLAGKLEEVGFRIARSEHRGFPFHSLYQWLIVRREVFPLRKQIRTRGAGARLANLLVRAIYWLNVLPWGQRLIVTAVR